ncbi:S8 family serine peptidase [Kordiimonas sp.]|uniref:S8 family serine peptidase n=1 Tax=Kordiimonas sp. TaxID=1970157 RepID=UPI003A9092C4
MRRNQLLLALAATLSLSACGGGGGVSPGSVPKTASNYAPSPTVPALPAAKPLTDPNISTDSEEYRTHGGLDMINMAPVYEAGFSGKGQIIAILDGSFDIDHPELNDNIHPASINIANRNLGMEAFKDSWEAHEHGNLVSGVAVAERNGVGMHGIAFNAQLLAIAEDDGSSDQGIIITADTIVKGIDYAIANGARVISTSSLLLTGEFSDSGNQKIYSAMKRAAAKGAIFVIAGGNGARPTPRNFNPVALGPELYGHVIIAGGLTEDGVIHAVADRAGDARSIYLSTQARGLGQLNNHDGIWFPTRFQGTSIAAPQIAAAIAILYEAFPNIDGEDAFNILMETAKDLGAPGVDEIYGGGLIDVGAAIQPLGQQKVAVLKKGGKVEFVDLGASLLATSPAFGDALTRGAIGRVMTLDKYNRSFFVDLPSRTLQGRGPSDLNLFMDELRRHHATRLTMGGANRVDVYFSDNREDPLAPTTLAFTNSEVGHSGRPALRYSAALDAKSDAQFAYGLPVTSLMGGGHGGPQFFSEGYNQDAVGLAFTPGKSIAVSRQFGARFKVSMAVGEGWYNTDVLGYGQHTGEAPQVSSALVQIEAGIGPLDFGWQVRAIREDGTLLGSMASGLMQFDARTDSTFNTIRANARLGSGLRITADYTVGNTDVNGQLNALVGRVRDIRTNTFHISAIKDGIWGRDDQLAFGVSQPLRVSHAVVSLNTATGRDYETDTLLFERRNLRLSPTGREINLDLAYRAQLMPGSHFQVNALYQINSRHVVSAKPETGVLLSLQSVF